MQASDLWCNLVQGGRASHTEEAERPAATFGVLLSSSTNSQHYHEEDKTELERSKQVNNQTRTHLIHYLVGMTIRGAACLSFFVKNDSNYPVIKSSRASRDADGRIHSETGWISWDFLYKHGIFCRRLEVGLKAGRLWIELVCISCGSTISLGKKWMCVLPRVTLGLSFLRRLCYASICVGYMKTNDTGGEGGLDVLTLALLANSHLNTFPNLYVLSHQDNFQSRLWWQNQVF